MEEACEYGLPRGTCFVARRLELVAVAGRLWISWCFGWGVFFSFFFVFIPSNAHGLVLQVRGHFASCTSLLVRRFGIPSLSIKTFHRPSLIIHGFVYHCTITRYKWFCIPSHVIHGFVYYSLRYGLGRPAITPKNRQLVRFHIVRMAFCIRDNHEMRWARAPRLRYHHDSGNNKAASLLRLLRLKVSNHQGLA